MITTRFLSINEYELYGDWLRSQSSETLSEYFGIVVSDDFVGLLINRIINNPEEHYFLVAYNGTEWTGVIHMARISEHQVEFGVMVSERHRHQGIADQLMSEALVWIQNRRFDHLYLHCLNRNSAMKHLAIKHGLELHSEDGDIDAEIQLPPPSILTYTREAVTLQKNIFWRNMRQPWFPFVELHG